MHGCNYYISLKGSSYHSLLSFITKTHSQGQSYHLHMPGTGSTRVPHRCNGDPVMGIIFTKWHWDKFKSPAFLSSPSSRRNSSGELTPAGTWGSGNVWNQSAVRDAGCSHVRNIIKRRTCAWWRTWNGYKGGWSSIAWSPNETHHISFLSVHWKMDLLPRELQCEDMSQAGPAPKIKVE